MDTGALYEKIMLEFYFNKIKNIRDRWNTEKNNCFPAVSLLIDIAGEDHRVYEYSMRRSSEIVFEMLADVIASLLKKYELPVKYYDLRKEETDAYYVGDNREWIDYAGQHNVKKVLAFSRKDKQQDVLFIFKEFGILNRVPKRTLVELMRAAKLKRFCYISYVEENAFSEVISHNKNEEDPTRGTGIYSFKQFMDGFFGKDEYNEFKKYADLFSKKIHDYFGFALVRTLNPNVFYSFKRTARQELMKLNLTAIGAANGISESQREIIGKNFFDAKNYEVLFGSSDFAQSYLTAEWLFTSLEGAGNIDLTAVAMGYFKAIEQILFSYLKNHTHEKDGAFREVFVGRDKAYANEYGYAPLVSSLVDDVEKSKDLALGSLIGFFGYHDLRRKRYYKRNQDLLVSGINESTYEFIVDTFGRIAGLRNEYFHKDNLNDWNKVIEARSSARLVFYIILGAYSISEDDKTALGLIRVDEHDDFYKLCEYINRRSFDPFFLEVPILYINDTSDPNMFVYPHHDDYIEYDNYGEPIYSGVYFREFGKGGRVYKVKRDHLPKEIWEGTLVLSESLPITIKPSGAQKQIFCNGKFVADSR